MQAPDEHQPACRKPFWRRKDLLLDASGDLFAHGQTAIADFVIDSMPVPMCKRVRARRCRTVRGHT